MASPHNDAPELQEKLRQHIANALPAYFMPSAIVVLPRLPLTINGKVDKGALLAHEQQRRAERVRPESTLANVKRFWQKSGHRYWMTFHLVWMMNSRIWAAIL